MKNRQHNGIRNLESVRKGKSFLQKQEIEASDTSCRVVRKKVDVVTLYEVTESELRDLEKGRQTDIYLNFSIFCFSVSLTCLVALCTSTFESEAIRMGFFCMLVIGMIIGAILLILWWQGKDTIKETIKTIRARKEI